MAYGMILAADGDRVTIEPLMRHHQIADWGYWKIPMIVVA
jgi:hypothetical protein